MLNNIAGQGSFLRFAAENSIIAMGLKPIAMEKAARKFKLSNQIIA
jgi:hypothetical protein